MIDLTRNYSTVLLNDITYNISLKNKVPRLHPKQGTFFLPVFHITNAAVRSRSNG